MASGREVNNLPLVAGLACARRVDTLKVILSQTSVTKQERKRSACIRLPTFKCGPPAVEPQSIPSPSASFTDCESDFSDNFLITSSKEGGVPDFNDSINSVAATDSNFDYNAASDIDHISSSEKFRVTISYPPPRFEE